MPEAKVVILGAQGVGKTSVIHRYVGHMFEQHTSPTIGASFFSCKIRIDDQDLELLIWDTAGQERFRSMAPMYYRNANAAILMYDITCYSSFESMKEWVTELKVRLEEPIIICVVGNKVDKHTQRQVGFKEAAEYAMSIGSLYHECSALNSKGVEVIFLDIAQEIIKQSAKIKERKDRDAAFQEGEIIRVTSTKKRELTDSTEERSFLCC
ncbi:ras-related protein Rab-21 [Trichonephila clavipes]|uniref:Ras-related protein Rab-21 n=1 Tax=Trichonephila inaurata madagascariensis TaxID=2747483 RepID=A0A8X6MDG9_9ARAC|nr:ras-related protein Rab-21 [Trichonephila inaurata madagascariensis]GFV47058.1 ras-related protein Rab-21 [Trichonephila clavipes]